MNEKEKVVITRKGTSKDLLKKTVYLIILIL